VGPVKLSNLLTIIAVVLATVKWTSITGGPTLDDAIVAIRVAQRDLYGTSFGLGEKERRLWTRR